MQNLHYFDPASHNDKCSNDPLGNMQRWFVILSELYLALCQITGDTSWLEKKERGVEDNINSIVARIMKMLHECVEQEILGGEKVEELQASLRALSPIAKLWSPPPKEDSWSKKTKEINIAEELIGWMDDNDNFNRKEL